MIFALFVAFVFASSHFGRTFATAKETETEAKTSDPLSSSSANGEEAELDGSFVGSH